MKKKVPLYIALSSLAERYRNSSRQFALGHSPMAEHCHDEFYRLAKEYLPSGSGFDAGTKANIESFTPRIMAFYTLFHHMDENGGYAGWTEHVVRAYAEFGGFELTVSGRDRDQIRDFIGDTFHQALTQEVEYQVMPAKEHTV